MMVYGSAAGTVNERAPLRGDYDAYSAGPKAPEFRSSKSRQSVGPEKSFAFRRTSIIVPAMMRRPASRWHGASVERIPGTSTRNASGPIASVGSRTRVSGQNVDEELSVLPSNRVP
jgi:hypothetical protein